MQYVHVVTDIFGGGLVNVPRRFAPDSTTFRNLKKCTIVPDPLRGYGNETTVGCQGVDYVYAVIMARYAKWNYLVCDTFDRGIQALVPAVFSFPSHTQRSPHFYEL